MRELEEATRFYDAWLPALGFTERYHGRDWKVWAARGELPATAYFAITESREHAPNENRIAFWASDREEVDRLAALVAAAGADELSGPKEMPYGPDYYAVYFADSSGNRFEVYHRAAG